MPELTSPRCCGPVAQTHLEETAALVEPLLRMQSRAETVVPYEHVQPEHRREVHTRDL